MSNFLKLYLLSFVTASLSAHAGLLEPNYIYAEQPMHMVNWLYIGLVPRAENPKDVRVVISKKAHTMHVILQMQKQDVSDYPKRLISRFKEVEKIVTANALEIRPILRWQNYQKAISDLEGEIASPEAVADEYQFGLKTLQKYFPQNVFVLASADGSAVIEMHFVYPITTHRLSSFPPAKDYVPYALDERRSRYTVPDGEDTEEPAPGTDGKTDDWNDHIFGGFPAVWLDPDGDGTGIHGPIRFSRDSDRRRDGKRGGMEIFWPDNEFLNETYDPRDGITPTYRWDVVRTPESHGCFRSEIMELRHILPAEKRLILGDVVFQVIDDLDRISIPGVIENKVVNVDYYMISPYSKPNKVRWLKKYLLPKGQKLEPWLAKEVHTFPYLDPMTVEFRTSTVQPLGEIMGQLNQAK